MIDNMMFYVNGREKALIDCTEKEIDIIMEDYHFQDAVGFIKHLVRQNLEQKKTIEDLEQLLHEDMRKEDFES